MEVKRLIHKREFPDFDLGMDSLDVGSGNFLVWLEVEKHALSAGRGDPAVAVEEGLDLSLIHI